ncbi:HlyIII-domain-containing protein [Fistulina hepatica ATCC 64428]|uniref:HlyIII-domain-containing protein n=1 Tax=Fistulina hepatica ATCC 64428 TaxID=1128425 RepID=A0A0D7AQ20_9AGAR|nr:HlyIII-domain-containing protein [Fistulina hepatica ATCC 64428]
MHRRRLSAPVRSRKFLCHTLPPSLEPLDLSSASPIEALASLRYLLLSFLADVEARLSQLRASATEACRTAVLTKLEEAAAWAYEALETLEGIRADLMAAAEWPDFHFGEHFTVENFRAHLPDMPTFDGVRESLQDVRERLSDLPTLEDVRQSIPDGVRARMPDLPDLPSLDSIRAKFDAVRARFYDQGLFPSFSRNLPSLDGRPSSAILSDLLDALLATDVVPRSPVRGIEKTAMQVRRALQRSFHGMRLIERSDVPAPWCSNPFVTRGYRFIPLDKWPLLILSLFALHNETLNIHTHLIPAITWAARAVCGIVRASLPDTPEMVFMCFATLCLFSSVTWHVMSGCAHHGSMELCARIDYIGIGWLISASVGTIVYYGFQCHPSQSQVFLAFCGLMGVLGNIFPFMRWFNHYEYRGYRILFFLVLALSAVAPLAVLSHYYGLRNMLSFITPVFPSLLSYITGLVFYATHVPERFLPVTWRRRLDLIGGGSHAIWHCFIVLAVSLHRSAIGTMQAGIVGCPASR